MRPALTLILVAGLAGATAGPAPAQEPAHEHEAGEHAHHHGDFPEYVDIFFTHHAYLERKLHPRFDATVAAAANGYAESLELVWQFNRWLGAEIAAVTLQTDPEVGDGAGGFGDLEIAPMVAFVRDADRQLIVTARSGFVLPTGDENEGLGIDGWAWEPGLLVWKGFGAERRGALQAELGYGRAFLNEGEDEEELVYNLGLSWWTRSNFIPILELNGVERLGEHHAGSDPADDHDHEHEEGEEHASLVPRGDRGLGLAHAGDLVEAPDRLVSGTVGFRYGFANGQQWGAGIQLPLLGDTDAYDWRLVVGGIIHLQ